MFVVSNRLMQPEIYQRLRTMGSPWLKSHVLYADNKTVVLNKPTDLVCQLNHSPHKLKSERNLTFLNHVFEDIRRWLAPNADPHSVHRLDRLTTGCFLVPIQHSSAKYLSAQFQNGDVKKSYLALVRGGEKSFPATTGEINDPILYSDGRAEIHPVGKMAKTRWKLMGSSPKAPISLVQLDLITGNKHQLRIHLAKVLKVPILGDTYYSRKPLNSSIMLQTTIPDDRLFLHSAEISIFQHHSTGKRYCLTIGAPVPTDFVKICNDLDIPLPPSSKEASLLVNDQVDGSGNSALHLWDPTGRYQ